MLGVEESGDGFAHASQALVEERRDFVKGADAR